MAIFRSYPCRLVSSTLSSPRTLRLRLEPIGAEYPEWMPGQRAALRLSGDFLPSGARSFAIASSPHERSTLEFLIKGSNAWSLRLVECAESGALNPGAEIEAELGPPGGGFSFALKRGTKGEGPLVLIAGGSGIAPFLSMLEHLAWADERRPTLLCWWAATKDELAPARDFSAYQRTFPGFHYTPVLTHDPLWSGERGRPTAILIERLAHEAFALSSGAWDWTARHGAAKGASYWLSGPPGFMKSCAAALTELGVPRRLVVRDAPL